MPIYEYACKSCDHTLDALQKMTDDPLVECPACGEPALRKLLSAPRFRLKGEGWYETDFKKDNQKNVHKSDAEPAKSDKKQDDSKTKQKTEEKAEKKTAVKSTSDD